MKKRKIIIRSIVCVISACMMFGLAGCGFTGKNEAEKAEAEKEISGKETSGKETSGKEEQTEVQVFLAASLRTAVTELAEAYEKERPDVKIVLHADSSGTLLAQIREGYECDVFFSAAEKQMDMLEKDGLVVDGTRADVLKNRLVLIAGKDSRTKAESLDTLNRAKSIALAGGTVPAGAYTREALVRTGVLERVEDVSKISTEQISEALGGVEISEQDNVSKVLLAVAEGACETGTTYYSDTYGYEDKVRVVSEISEELTGEVTYPICLVKRESAAKEEKEAAADFLQYIRSEKAKKIFESYYFDTYADK